MKHKKIYWITGLIVVCVAMYIVITPSYFDSMSQDAQQIIIDIEDYKKRKGEYPQNINLLGYDFDESGPYYYNLYDDGTYNLSFPIGFSSGGSYSSDDPMWKEVKY